MAESQPPYSQAEYGDEDDADFQYLHELTFEEDDEDDGAAAGWGTHGGGAADAAGAAAGAQAWNGGGASENAVSGEPADPGHDVDDDEEEEEEEEEEDAEPVEYDFSALPKHHCVYCGVHDPAAVVRCVRTDKWFCNGRGRAPASHIVTHLVRSRNKEVALHADSALGDTVIECYNCGCRNVFLLGFMPSTVDATVVLICRNRCLQDNSVKEMGWDATQWLPIISDKAFLEWIVREPTVEERRRARQLTNAQITKLEELWRSDPAATVEDLERPGVTDEPDPVKDEYKDADEFQAVFGPLVRLEAEYDRKCKEEQSMESVQVRWSVGLNRRIQASFTLGRRTDAEQRVLTGEELRLRYAGDGILNAPWEGVGVVVRISPLDEVLLELRGDQASRAPTDQYANFSIEYVWKSVSFDRMHAAMKTLVVDQYSVTGYLYHLLLGHGVDEQTLPVDVPSHVSAPGLPALNASQAGAVSTVLRRPLALIQGPPGTGKTVTTATLVYHMSRIHKTQILVTAPSNVGVDQLTEKIHQTGLRVVRLVAKSREAVSSSVDFLSLHELVRELSRQHKGELHKLALLKEVQGELSRADDRRYRQLLHRTERLILENADVICCTCMGAGDPRLKKFRFRHVLLDEATQATEPEALIPIVKGAKQVVLVGDHRQLPPVVLCKQAAGAGMGRSLFERLIERGRQLGKEDLFPVRLDVQYRMHPEMSEFPSNRFYEGSLQNAVSAADRAMLGPLFAWPRPDCPMMFLAMYGSQEEFSASGTSYVNRAEAETVERVVSRFLDAGLTPQQIGVITPYEGQRAYVVQHMARWGQHHRKQAYEDVEVASVDAFQGREKDLIVLSCVRSNDRQGIGFLSDARRLNVALTRAKYGLVVVGNPMVLAKHALWHDLLTHFKRKEVLVEGPLNNLRLFRLHLPRPRLKWKDKYAGLHLHSGTEAAAEAATHGAAAAAAAAAATPDQLRLEGFGDEFRFSAPGTIVPPSGAALIEAVNAAFQIHGDAAAAAAAAAAAVESGQAPPPPPGGRKQQKRKTKRSAKKRGGAGTGAGAAPPSVPASQDMPLSQAPSSQPLSVSSQPFSDIDIGDLSLSGFSQDVDLHDDDDDDVDHV